jgi:hypothetical protein
MFSGSRSSDLSFRLPPHYLDTGMAAQHHGFGSAAQLGSGGRQAGDGSGGQLG